MPQFHITVWTYNFWRLHHTSDACSPPRPIQKCQQEATCAWVTNIWQMELSLMKIPKLLKTWWYGENYSQNSSMLDWSRSVILILYLCISNNITDKNGYSPTTEVSKEQHNPNSLLLKPAKSKGKIINRPRLQ